MSWLSQVVPVTILLYQIISTNQYSITVFVTVINTSQKESIHFFSETVHYIRRIPGLFNKWGQSDRFSRTFWHLICYNSTNIDRVMVIWIRNDANSIVALEPISARKIRSASIDCPFNMFNHYWIGIGFSATTEM